MVLAFWILKNIFQDEKLTFAKEVVNITKDIYAIKINQQRFLE